MLSINLKRKQLDIKEEKNLHAHIHAATKIAFNNLSNQPTSLQIIFFSLHFETDPHISY